MPLLPSCYNHLVSATRMWLFLSFWTWVVLSLFRPIRANDLWWQLASGRYIVAHHLFPSTDVFSLTCRGRPWIDFEWLYQVVLYSFYRMGSFIGIAFLKTALIAAALVFLIRRLRQAGIPELGAYVFATIVFAACAANWSERADLISIALVSTFMQTMEGIRTGRKAPRRLWGWIAVFFIWANAHAGFVVGLGIATFYGIEFARAGRLKKSQVVLWLLGLWSVTLLNPYGLNLWKQILHSLLLVSKADQMEFLPPPFARMSIFWMALVLQLLFLARSIEKKQPLPWIALTLFALLGYQAIRHARFVIFFMFAAFPFGVESICEDLKKMTVNHTINLWAGGVFALLALSQIPSVGFGQNPLRVPVEACNFLEAQQIRGRFFIDFDFGSYWVWRFNGDPPVFVDGRSSTVDGYTEIRRQIYQAETGSPTAWRMFLDRYAFTATVIRCPAPAAGSSRLAENFPKSQWALIYWDDLALLFIKRSAYPASRIKELEFHCIEPDRQPNDLAAEAARNPEERSCLEKDVMRNRQLHPLSQRTQEFEAALQAHG